MTLITSHTLTGGTSAMANSDKIAVKDITAVNELGQTVVLVPAGQPIPADFDQDQALAATVPQRDASYEQIEQARGVQAESKPRRATRKK